MKFTLTAALLVTLFAISGSPTVQAQDANETESLFTTPRVDLGCVVSDIDASIKFYTTVIGFEQTGEFSVDAKASTALGLTDQQELNVKVLTLGEGEGATQLKLMQVATESAKPKNDYIHSSLGFSYITIYVKDIDAAMARLKSANVKPVTTPQDLPGMPVKLALVRDPDGNIIELIGAPAKNSDKK